MASLLTTKFRHKVAKELATNRALETFYTAVGKSLPFVSDSLPPAPADSVQGAHIDIYRSMIFGKRILPEDVSMMIRRNDWVAGTVYTPYDHENERLFDASVRFFVVVNEGLFFSVFKCLSNNNGVPSTAKPSLFETAADDEFYVTADGYQWKYMYSIGKSTYEKFTTTSFIPVVANTDVTANAINGAIETIQVVNRGTRYNAYNSGLIQAARVGGNNQLFTIEPSAAANSDFYKNSVIKITSGPGAGQQRVISEYIVSGGVKRVLINQPFDTNNIPTEESTYEISPNVVVTGDGQDFIGRALVNAISNTIYAVEITNKGEGYSWASAVVVSNTGIINSVSNTYIQANTAVLRVIISPPGGHGSDVETELGATQVCISQTISTVEAGGKIVANNDFRTVSVIRDPMFANVVVTVANTSGSFSVGDTVLQPFDTVVGTGYNRAVIASINSSELTLTQAKGVFSTSNTYYGTANGVPQTPYDTVYGPIHNAANSVTARIASTNSSNPSLYFDQTTTLVCNVTSTAHFIEDELLDQVGNANGYVYFANNTIIKLVDTKGVITVAEEGTSSGIVYGDTSQAVANVTAVQLPDLIKGSGEVLYIENITPIARANGQTETIKVILEF